MSQYQSTLAVGEELKVRKLVNVREAAIALNVGVGAVYALVERGELASIRIGRQIRIPLIALSEFLGYDVVQNEGQS